MKQVQFEHEETRGDGQLNVQILDSSDLFRGKNQVIIVHNRDRYRLVMTRSGKLVLNK